MDNLEIAEIFSDIAGLMERKKESWFKIRAYRKAAEEIRKLMVDLRRIADEDKLKEIPGVGDAIAKKITEMLNTGKLQFYEKLKAEVGETSNEQTQER